MPECKDCNGKGWLNTCRVCGGTGTVTMGYHPTTGEPMLTVCRACYQGKTRPPPLCKMQRQGHYQGG